MERYEHTDFSQERSDANQCDQGPIAVASSLADRIRKTLGTAVLGCSTLVPTAQAHAQTKELIPFYYKDEAVSETDKSGNVSSRTFYGFGHYPLFRERYEYSPRGYKEWVRRDDWDNRSFRHVRDTYLRRNGSVHSVHDLTKDTFEAFGVSGEPVVYATNATSAVNRQYFVVDRNGKRLGNYWYEQSQSPFLTTQQYIKRLADALRMAPDAENPYERLAEFFNYLFEFVYDRGPDYWQTPSETVTRVENGLMLGDCDDYSFLAQAILKEWGIKSHVVFIPHHLTCMWKEQHDAKFTAYSMCTYGLDCNGHRYPGIPKLSKRRAFATTKEAANSLLPKYCEPDVRLSPFYRFDSDGPTIIETKGDNRQEKRISWNDF